MGEGGGGGGGGGGIMISSWQCEMAVDHHQHISPTPHFTDSFCQHLFIGKSEDILVFVSISLQAYALPADDRVICADNQDTADLCMDEWSEPRFI